MQMVSSWDTFSWEQRGIYWILHMTHYQEPISDGRLKPSFQKTEDAWAMEILEKQGSTFEPLR